MIFTNADAPNILKDLRNFVLGQGIVPYRVRQEKQTNGEWKEIHEPVQDKQVLDYLADNEEIEVRQSIRKI